MIQKFYYINKNFCHHQKNFLFKNTFKVTLQYLFDIFILFNTVSYIKLNIKLKIDPKMCTFKTLEKIWKTLKKFWKKSVATLYLIHFVSFNTTLYYKCTIKLVFEKTWKKLKKTGKDFQNHLANLLKKKLNKLKSSCFVYFSKDFVLLPIYGARFDC